MSIAALFDRLRRTRIAIPDLAVDRVPDFAAYQRHARAMHAEYGRRRELECQLSDVHTDRFEVEGLCYPCRRRVKFAVDYAHASGGDGPRTPNWRESLLCPRCGLNNRMRAVVQLLEQQCGQIRRSPIYVTEQRTRLFQQLRARYPSLQGSEYLGLSSTLGSVRDGIRNEDLTRLTFEDASFEVVMSFDVLEHIPDYPQAISEIQRVLKPGGTLMLTVPFRLDLERTLVRAILTPDGSVTHVLEPEYHGDPLQAGGILCFQHFGWDLLERLRAGGFCDCNVLLYWSRDLGYLGIEQMTIVATAAEAT